MVSYIFPALLNQFRGQGRTRKGQDKDERGGKISSHCVRKETQAKDMADGLFICQLLHKKKIRSSGISSW